MSLHSPRADNLGILCDSAILISQGIIQNSETFGKVIATFRHNIGKEPWKRTRIYHYWSALRDLQLINASNGQIELTNKGVELARIAKFGNLEHRALDSTEKLFFRDLLLTYEPFRQFLSLFLTTGRSFESYDQLDAEGGIVAFDKDAGSGLQMLINASGEVEPLPEIRWYEIKWTLKNWCKDLDLIDEISLERIMGNIENRHRRVLFPIKIANSDLPFEKFKQWLDLLISSVGYKTKYIPIPLIMYDFCTCYFVSVKLFHDLLGALYRAYPEQYNLEKIPSLYIDERPPRIQGYQNYPRVNDFYRCNLVLR